MNESSAPHSVIQRIQQIEKKLFRSICLLTLGMLTLMTIEPVIAILLFIVGVLIMLSAASFISEYTLKQGLKRL